MTTFFRLLFVVAGLGLSGCVPPMDAPAPDAMDMADAGPPDAVGIDAPPPWEPTEPLMPGEPCEIVSEVPDPMYDDRMANYAVRFKDGQGLESSPDIRQTGALQVQDAHIGNREVVEKRRGADELADTRSSTPDDIVPRADRRAIWSRGDEVLLQTHDSIYAERVVTTDVAAWRRVGSWIQTRLREAYADVFSDAVMNVATAKLGESTVVAYSLDDATLPDTGVYFAVYGPSMEREFEATLSAASSAPRLSALDSDSIRVSWQSGSGSNPVTTMTYTNGAAALDTLSTPLGSLAFPAAWDVHGAYVSDLHAVTATAAATPTADDMTLHIRLGLGGSFDTIQFTSVGGDLVDVATAVYPVTVGGAAIVSVVALVDFGNTGNNYGIIAYRFSVDTTTAAITQLSAQGTVLTDNTDTGHTVSLSYVDPENVYIAVEQESGAHRKVSYYTQELVNIGGPSAADTGIQHELTALVSQGAIVAGTPTDTLVSAGAEPLNPGFVEALLPFGGNSSNTQRNGWVVFAPRTEEVIARSFVGYTGNTTTRAARAPKGSFVHIGDQLTWGGAVTVLSEPGGTNGLVTNADELNSIAACALDLTQRPNAPAFADETAISAHAGYPRAYNGIDAPFEHDWHTMPRITSAPTTVASANDTTNGTHFFAVTWEWDDGHGIRYRSAPFFFGSSVTLGGSNLAYSVPVEPLSHTERENVRVVVWATVADGVQFFRAYDAPAPTTGSTTAIVGAIEDSDLERNEQLDQGPVPGSQGITATSERARVTDFVARAGDRLFSRDPLKGSLARFTIPSREASGYAMHWPLAFALEEPDERDVTAALEMDGRIVIGSELGLALLTSDGPDATGAGSFGLPTSLRASVGIKDQAQLARTPIGYAYGTRNGGAKLLTPGLTVEDLEKFVERTYKIDGANIVAIAYDQHREEIVFLSDSDKTLRLNTSSGRWGSDSNRLGRDLAVTRDGQLYLIRSDGKVLKQVQDAWADGGAAYYYSLKVSTPWIRDQARDGTTHSNFRLGSVYISGEYLGPHDLHFRIYKDFDDSTPWRSFVVESADIVANNAAGHGYIYGVRIGGQESFLAARIEVQDGTEEGETYRLAQMDVSLLPDGNSKYAELPAAHYAKQV